MTTRRLLVAVGMAVALALTACSPGHRDPKTAAHAQASAWTVLAHGIGRGSTVWLAVDATALDDIWVVGLVEYRPTASDGYGYPAVAHWDGERWDVHFLRKRRVQRCLGDVDAVARDDVWVMLCGIYHYDGRAWHATTVEGVETSRVGLSASTGAPWVARADTRVGRYSRGHWHLMKVADQGALGDIAVLADDDAWVVGYAGTAKRYGRNPLVAHWDGAAWRTTPVPRLQCTGFALSFTSPRDGWMMCNARWYSDEFLVVRWNGTAWRFVGRGRIDRQLLVGDPNIEPRVDIVATSSGQVWLSREGQLAALTGSRLRSLRLPEPKAFTPVEGYMDLGRQSFGMCHVPGTDVVLAAGGIWLASKARDRIVHDVVWRNG